MNKQLPRKYTCRYITDDLPVDGSLTHSAWSKAEWTDDFEDIEGSSKPIPSFKTRAKLLWSDKYLYIGAFLEEPHVWATITKKNSVIFHDNDFEVFIDPDGDSMNYHEFEMNALNTIWELTLVKPYRDGGPVIDPDNIEGLKTAVRVSGTINDSSDTDEGWSLEIAIPWAGLVKYAGTMKCPPSPGDTWRMNFSRVEWKIEIVNGEYVKKPGKEDNWVWSPQGMIDMHQPEHWGYVRFDRSKR